jgi:hypothetical protein
MKLKILVIIIFSLSLLCTVVSAQNKDPFANVSPEDMNQTPLVAVLPCGDGVLFAYHFSFDVTHKQVFWMLHAHMLVAQNDGLDLTDQVYIIGFFGPKRVVFVSADFKMNEIELREESIQKRKYKMSTWHGDTASLIDYLFEGATGSPVIKKGKIDDEILPFPNPNDPCSKREGA